MTVSRLRDDSGFTLTELIVVTGLLGMVLAIAWAGFNVTAGGSKMSNRQAHLSREIAAPLELADRALTQAFDFDTAFPGLGPNRCAFYTDQDNNGYRERYVIAIVGTQLQVTTEEENGRPRKTVAWSEANRNIAAAQPLFRYYDMNGNEITTMSQVPNNVKRIVVTIVTEHDGDRLSDSRTVFLRNR